MRKKVQPSMIGAFILGAVALFVAGLFYFSSKDYFVKKDKCILYFEHSVNGLEKGAPVKFKGVDIGRVQDIMIRFNQPDHIDYIPVLVELKRESILDGSKAKGESERERYSDLIHRGLRAKLVYQSYLTGLLFVELDFIDEQHPPFLVQSRPIYYEIPTESSQLSELWASAIHVFERLGEVDWVGAGEAVANIATTLNDGISHIEFEKLNDDFLGALNSVRTVFDKIDTQSGPLLDNAHSTMDEIRRAFEKIDSIVKSVDETLHPEASFRYKVDGALKEFAKASKAVRELADILKRNPNALVAGKLPPSK